MFVFFLAVFLVWFEVVLFCSWCSFMLFNVCFVSVLPLAVVCCGLWFNALFVIITMVFPLLLLLYVVVSVCFRFCVWFVVVVCY